MIEEKNDATQNADASQTENTNNTKSTKNDAEYIRELITCCVSHSIFLEPVRLVHKKYNKNGISIEEDGITIEKDMVINIIERKQNDTAEAQCPITRKKIMGYRRARDIEALVENYLMNHPEKKDDQYQKQKRETPSVTPREYIPVQQEQDIEANNMPEQQALQDIQQERPIEERLPDFDELEKTISAALSVYFMMLVTTGVNTMGAAILKKITSDDYNLGEVASVSTAGGAVLCISVIACYRLLACYFPQQLKHLNERIDAIDTMPAPIRVVSWVSFYNVSFILAGVLGAAMCKLEHTTLRQSFAAAATGAAVLDCPIIAANVYEGIKYCCNSYRRGNP